MPALGPQKFWNIKNPSPRKQAALSRELSIHPIIAQLLINRGVKDAQEADDFLTADLNRLNDPFLFKDMDKAVERIRTAKKNKERVLIFGDYDVDGVTSTALMFNTLKKFGLHVINHIPHRLHDGYGLNEDVGKIAKKNGVTLVIAVDCGITAFKEVDLLNSMDIDIIVVDHHEPAHKGIPSATAVIDPKRKDCGYPFRHLAAVGLVAKVTQALTGKVTGEALDLVALGTIADVVPLRGENRIYVKAGLPHIEKTKNKGLAALLEVARIKGKKIRPHSIGFVLGPRINASGRMDSAHKALDLLLCDEHDEALRLAQFLETNNARRQKLQKDVIQEALDMVEREVNFQDQKVIVLCKEGWHKGVLGIVAARVAEQYFRPAIVMSLKEGVGTASARSIAGFHLDQALAHCTDLLEAFGGHKLAAGLTIKEENIDPFRKAINEFAQDILEVRDLIPALNIDYEIPLSTLSVQLSRTMELLEPFGEGNPSPLFCSRQLTVKSNPAVLGRETLKFWVTDGQVTVSAVGFGMARYKDLVRLGEKVDLAYQLGIDDWNKAATVQLTLKDIKPSRRE